MGLCSPGIKCVAGDCPQCKEAKKNSRFLHTSAESIEKAQHAFRDYVVWCYATPNAGLNQRLAQQLFQSMHHHLDSEAKAYFSVQVNEFHQPGVSGSKKDDQR